MAPGGRIHRELGTNWTLNRERVWREKEREQSQAWLTHRMPVPSAGKHRLEGKEVCHRHQPRGESFKTDRESSQVQLECSLPRGLYKAYGSATYSLSPPLDHRGPSFRAPFKNPWPPLKTSLTVVFSVVTFRICRACKAVSK